MTAYTWGLLEAWAGLPVLLALAATHRTVPVPAERTPDDE